MGKKNLFAGRKRYNESFTITYMVGKTKKKATTILPVWEHPRNLKPKATDEFIWPDYRNEPDRIKKNSESYGKMSITEAFSKAYNLDLNMSDHSEAVVNHIPTDVQVGDILNIRVISADKSGVVLECMDTKQVVNSSVNLFKYHNFKNFLPKDTIKGVVTKVTKNNVVVDPISPLFHNWIDPIIADPISQRNLKNVQTVIVKNLRLVGGGFLGDAVVPNVSDFLGEDFTIETFIPGSQIVLNIEDDFTRWEGKTVEAFVTSYTSRPGRPGKMSLVCSVKEYLKFLGDINTVGIFNAWCDNDEEWNTFSQAVFKGNVTGIINTSKKCGVFVEIPELNITGMVSTPADELVNYAPHTQVKVRISDLEESMRYDEIQDRMVHDIPYVEEDHVLRKCTVKPVLTFA